MKSMSVVGRITRLVVVAIVLAYVAGFAPNVSGDDCEFTCEWISMGADLTCGEPGPYSCESCFLSCPGEENQQP